MFLSNRNTLSHHLVLRSLGLKHTFQDGIEYGGITGYMGSAVKKSNYPQRCYNGQNHWHLGWYEDRTLEVSLLHSRIYYLAAFVDYDKADEDEYVVLKVPEVELYLQYNRARAFNKDPGEYPDTVTIVRNDDNGTHLIAGLNQSEPLFQQMVGLETLTIEVCDTVGGSNVRPDIIRLSVGYGESLCTWYYESHVSGFASTAPSQTPFPAAGSLRRPSASPAPSSRPIGAVSPTAMTILPKRSSKFGLGAVVSVAVGAVAVAAVALFGFQRYRKTARGEGAALAPSVINFSHETMSSTGCLDSKPPITSWQSGR